MTWPQELHDFNFWGLFSCVLLAVGAVGGVFLIVRNGCCWYWKTSAIVSELEDANENLEALHTACTEVKAELVKANELLQRLATAPKP